MSTTNRAIIRGTIVGIRSTTHNTYIRIATDGGSTRGREDPSDYPEITFRGNKAAEGFQMKDHVTAQCYIRTAVYSNDGVARYSTVIEGETLERTKRILASYSDDIDEYDGGVPNDINTVIAIGEVSHIYQPRDGITLLNVETEVDGRRARAEFSCFRKQSDYVRRFLEPGDRVAVAGSIRTAIRDNRSMQNVVCLDVAKLEDE